ncbi:glutamate 5-kinase [Geopsychrobacter electrodiphilus]|uniref:glutamate 5-kinase n=1 Tax=Geopsychrobacter electrodiphilus TaxID=225196 RepID=UPI000361B7FD|nr:glutamate 5-kinase [Geopsychrobacter electrodiphilus]
MHMKDARPQILQQLKRVVIKVGSGVISTAEGLDAAMVARLAGEVSDLCERGIEVILVSSGAVAAGRSALGIEGRPKTIPQKQAAAAIGQPRIMRAYKEIFRQRNRVVAQVLLTRDDLSNRRRYLNAHNTLETLLEYGVTPIVNENDTVVVEEIRFGDNDNLSAMVACLMEADLLVVLSDVDGFYTGDPGCDPGARLLPLIERITPEIEAMAGTSRGTMGTGGMQTKLQAAQKAGLAGVPTLIVNGREPDIFKKVIQGEELGSLFLPQTSKLNARKRWLALSMQPSGRILLDAGAVRAVVGSGKSLLPSGITSVDGEFERGDAVHICDQLDVPFAIGVANYNRAELEQIKGHRCAEIEEILGYQYRDEAVYRDNLVLLRDTA